MNSETCNECRALLRRGDKEGLRALLEPLLKEHPEDAQAWYFRGALLNLEMEFASAFADFGKAIALKPDFPEALFERGAHYLHREQGFGQAIADFNEALRLRPAYLDALNLRGIAYQENGEVKKAIADFNRVLQRNPDAPSIRKRRAAAWAVLSRETTEKTDISIINKPL